MDQETQHHDITVLGTLSLTRVRHLNFPLDSPDSDHNGLRLKGRWGFAEAPCCLTYRF